MFPVVLEATGTGYFLMENANKYKRSVDLVIALYRDFLLAIFGGFCREGAKAQGYAKDRRCNTIASAGPYTLRALALSR